jgi:acyl transferase domain-containing protein/NAD(P)-dependent dehydrogenase (short-subunit alcohol dehydrogenase family)
MTTREPIAIVGLTALFPGSIDAAGFWQDIVAGRDLMGDVPAHYWLVEDYYDPNPAATDKTYGKRGAFLSPVAFNALEFGLPPTALTATDSAQLLALIGARNVLRDAARGRANHVPMDRVGIYLGVAATTTGAMNMAARLQRPVWVKALRESGLAEAVVQDACDRIAANYSPIQESTFPGILGNVVAGRVANRFNLGGSNFTVDAACASSLAAVSVALNDLYLENADMVIAGGVDALNDIQMFMCFSKTPALSPTGDCRPFSDAADGTMLGEGLSLFALRRLSDAERDGDQIYAVIRGLGSSSDGRAKSVYAPRPQGQALALRRAYEAAGYGPNTVELMEAHGTATPAGDAAEFEALRTVFSADNQSERQWCALGSVKSQIGHTKGAAGAAGLFKAAMALHHKVLPPTIKVERPNPQLHIESSPFYLNTESRPWIASASHPRRAAVSSFGFGGTNFHITLEEYQGPAVRPATLCATPTELILISGATRTEVAAACDRISSQPLTGNGWRHVARESQKQFDAAQRVRLAIVVSSEADLRTKLQSLAQQLASENGTFQDRPEVYFSQSESTTAPTVAFVFAGQGSQSVSMGKHLAMTFPFVQSVWDQAEPVLANDGVSLRSLVFPAPAFDEAVRTQQRQVLTATENAQPALAAAGLAHLALMRTLGVEPDFLAGHSFGELLALHAAGVFGNEELLKTARKRGQLMASTERCPGTMTAVSYAAEALSALLREWQCEVVIANYNSPSQAVLSGPVDAIENVEARLLEAKINFRRLPVSAAFHSDLVSESVGPFDDFLQTIEFSAPRIDVYSNTDAKPYPSDPDAIRKKLANQLAQPVRFADEIDELYQRGARVFVELGIGSALSSLIDETLKGREHVTVPVERKGAHGLTSMWEALGKLAVAGVRLDFEPLHSAFAPVEAHQETGNASSTFLIDGSAYGKPYPPRGGAAALPPPNPDHQKMPAAAVSAPSSLPHEEKSATQENPAMKLSVEALPTQDQPEPGRDLPAVRHESEWRWHTAPALPTVAAYDIHAQITLAQKATQEAILKTHALTLKSLESLVHGSSAAHEVVSVEERASVRPAVAATPAPLPKQEHFMAPPPSHWDSVPVAPVAIVPEPAPIDLPVRVAPTPDLAGLLLEVVSDKTGYPIDVLNLDMELEAGLGIDSIKRVEIFSAIQQRQPNLPEVKAEHMASLRSLRQIIEFLGDGNSQARPEERVAQPVAAPKSDPIDRLLLEVVSEKTGYPIDVLNLDMELEAGLGIDSIKRVEIFSAIQQRQPNLPEVKAEHMASLRTLRQIIVFLEGAPAPAVEPVAVPPAQLDEASAPKQGLTRREVREFASATPGLPMPGLAGCTDLAVKDDGEDGIAAWLVGELRIKGLPARLVDTVPTACPGLIIPTGFSRTYDARNSTDFHLDALRMLQALGDSESDPKVLVTIQNSGGDFNLSGQSEAGAWVGGIAAMAKTAAAEWPHASVKSIDIEAECPDRNWERDRLARDIVDELLQGGNDREVGLHASGVRTTLGTELVVSELGQLPVGPNSVLVVSGGARGVTAACLLELAKAAQPKLALLGRTDLREEQEESPELAAANSENEIKRLLIEKARAQGTPLSLNQVSQQTAEILAAREIRSTLRALRQAGSEAVYLRADVQDADSLAYTLDKVRQRFGSITGLIHAAGVLADKKISDKTEEQFRRVFTTKVEGLRSLLTATADDPLELIVCFSSVAARYGNTGQCDYAAANEVLNQVAAVEARRRGETCLVRSFGWGPWEGGMVTPGLAQQFKSRGVGLIPLADGARRFVEELRVSGGSVEVLITAGEELTMIEGAHADVPQAIADGAEQSIEILVNSRTYPLLDGHRIKQHATVPVVLALEWFHRFATTCCPHLEVCACQDLRVLRGVQLPDYEEAGHLLRVVLRKSDASATPSLHCELRSANGILHYTARLETKPRRETTQARTPNVSVKHFHQPDEARSFYEDALFHGPEFQVIHSIQQMDAQGATATLAGTSQMAWQSGPWQTEAAALDGALQVARLWGLKNLGSPSLPTRLGRYIHHAPPPEDGLLNCTIECRSVGSLSTLSDIRLADTDGRPIAELRDVEMHVLAE